MRLLPLLSVCLAALPLLACDDNSARTWQGYGEGEYVRVAPLEGGIVKSVNVERGDKVARLQVVRPEPEDRGGHLRQAVDRGEIGRASCRERV